MNIGVLGCGHIGATVARLLIKAGHSVALSNSRGGETLTQLVRELGPEASAREPELTVEFGAVVFVAVPWTKRSNLPSPHKFESKVLVDSMNAYSAEGKVVDLGECTSSEEVQRQFADALVVKAFNTLYWETLATRGTRHSAHRLILPLSGDHAHANRAVGKLISDAGFAPFELGPLRMGKLQSPGGPFYNKTLTIHEGKAFLQASLNV